VWLAGTAWSQVVGPQPGALGYPCKHARPDFLILVKGEYEIGPPGPGERAMGARLPLLLPTRVAGGPPAPAERGYWAMRSCRRERNAQKLGASFAMLQTFRDHAECQRLDL